MFATYLARAAGRLAREQDAATATEYAVMLALVLVVIIASVTALGQSLASSYADSNASLFS